MPKLRRYLKVADYRVEIVLKNKIIVHLDTLEYGKEKIFCIMRELILHLASIVGKGLNSIANVLNKSGHYLFLSHAFLGIFELIKNKESY